MSIILTLEKKWGKNLTPIIIEDESQINFQDLIKINTDFINIIKPGEIVALIGDFDPVTIIILLRLIDLGAIVMPLTKETIESHFDYFKTCSVKYIIENKKLNKTKNG